MCELDLPAHAGHEYLVLGESTTTDTMRAPRGPVSPAPAGARSSRPSPPRHHWRHMRMPSLARRTGRVSARPGDRLAKVRVDECHRCSPVVEPQVTTEVVAVGPFRSRVCTLRSPTTRGLASCPTASNVTHRRSRRCDYKTFDGASDGTLAPVSRPGRNAAGKRRLLRSVRRGSAVLTIRPQRRPSMIRARRSAGMH